jgi:hypothetical protein
MFEILKMYAKKLKNVCQPLKNVCQRGIRSQTSRTIFRDEVFDTTIYFLKSSRLFFKNVCQGNLTFDEEEVLNFKKAVDGLTSAIKLSKRNSIKNYNPFLWFYLKNDTSTVKEFEDYFIDGFKYQDEHRVKQKTISKRYVEIIDALNTKRTNNT